jgi:hypothetical protein
LFTAPGQVRTTLGIAAETLFGPKPGIMPMPRRGPRPSQPELPDLSGSAPLSGTRQVGNAARAICGRTDPRRRAPQPTQTKTTRGPARRADR